MTTTPSPQTAGTRVVTYAVAGARQLDTLIRPTQDWAAAVLSWAQGRQGWDGSDAGDGTQQPLVGSLLQSWAHWSFEQPVRHLRSAWQRATRGWATDEVWNLDQTMCLRLAEQLDYLARHGWGWPGNDEFPTPDSWTAALQQTARQLRRVTTSPAAEAAADTWMATPDGPEKEAAWHQMVEIETADRDAVRHALHWVADHHQHLWD